MASKAIVTLRLTPDWDSSEVRNWTIASDAHPMRLLLLGFLRDFVDLLAAVEPVGRHVVTPMRHAGGGIHRQRWAGQCIVRTTHTTPRRRLAALLNCHLKSPRTKPRADRP